MGSTVVEPFFILIIIYTIDHVIPRRSKGPT